MQALEGELSRSLLRGWRQFNRCDRVHSDIVKAPVLILVDDPRGSAAGQDGEGIANVEGFTFCCVNPKRHEGPGIAQATNFIFGDHTCSLLKNSAQNKRTGPGGDACMSSRI